MTPEFKLSTQQAEIFLIQKFFSDGMIRSDAEWLRRENNDILTKVALRKAPNGMPTELNIEMSLTDHVMPHKLNGEELVKAQREFLSTALYALVPDTTRLTVFQVLDGDLSPAEIPEFEKMCGVTSRVMNSVTKNTDSTLLTPYTVEVTKDTSPGVITTRIIIK